MKALWTGLIIGLLALGGIWASLGAKDKKTQPSTTGTASIRDVDVPDTAGQSAGEKLGLAGQLATNSYIWTEENYRRVREAGQPHYLNFYANWCPTCAAQQRVDLPLWNELGTDNQVIALRVNFNDSDTEPAEEQLAEDFGVVYQHTMFLIDSEGNQIQKFLGQTSAEQLKQAIAGVQ